jgi:hypothetical protein
MKARNTKKVLKKRTNSAMILARKVAGFGVHRIKTFWQNWQWVLALAALLYGIFLFYYQSTTATPARIKNCEEKITAHIAESDARLKKIEEDYSDVKLSLTRLEAMMNISLQDLSIMKGYITGEAHHK